MRSKSCNGNGLTMHGRFQDGQPSKLLIFLSLLSKICDFGSSHYPCSVTDAKSCHSSDKAAEASEMPKFVASPFQGCYCPRMCFDAFWSQFRVFVGAYTLARPSVHTCIVIFQTYGALGLPMCHIFQVSGSSLPVPIFIGRWIDHINLQAKVTKSGMK